LNKVVPSKNVNETDEQYVQRLAHYQYDAGNLDEAEMFEKNTLKKELGKLTKLPLYNLENIVKSLSKELILSLNEQWPLVTSEYNKLFAGMVRESTVIDFLKNIFNPKRVSIQQSMVGWLDLRAFNALSIQDKLDYLEVNKIPYTNHHTAMYDYIKFLQDKRII